MISYAFCPIRQQDAITTTAATMSSTSAVSSFHLLSIYYMLGIGESISQLHLTLLCHHMGWVFC